MFDSLSLSSPSLRISNLDDPDFVNRQCFPVIAQPIRNEDFSIDFINVQLIPEIKNIIKQDKKNKFETLPTLIRLILDNFPEDGSSIIRNEIFSTIQSTIKFGGPRKASDLTELAVEIASSIPKYYRDDIICEIISHLYQDEDQNTRKLAVHLISIVRDFWRVQQYFKLLARDKSSVVRGTVLTILPNCMIDDDSMRNILIQAANDTHPGVRQVAATVIAKASPPLLDEYKKLLSSSITVRYAFPSLPEIVMATSFSQIIDAFFEAIKIDRNDAAVALLETASKADIKSEEPLYLRAASELVSFTPFAWRLYSFAQNFTNQSDFIELLDPSNIPDWRTRYALLKQCEEFIPVLGNQLVRLAEIYSEDQTAIIRNESANLWAMLVNSDNSLIKCMEERLMRGSWHKRLVLCKVIKQVGISIFSNELVNKLKNDEICNVRDCINL